MRRCTRNAWPGNHHKYKGYPPVNIPDRNWPEKTINKAPRWCSVDLRDGNQALAEPLSVDQKLENNHGLRLPRWMQIALSSYVQQHAENTGTEVSARTIWQLFQQHYLSEHIQQRIEIVEYSEHALAHKKTAQAVAFLKLTSNGLDSIGAAIHNDALSASFNAMLQAVSALQKGSVENLNTWGRNIT